MLSSNATLRRMIWFLSGLSMLFVAVWQAPFYVVEGLASYLPLHLFAETFSIVVSMMVFGVAWNVYSKERPGNIVILSCALLAVGLIDFAHMLSFKGMPDFITPSGPEKAINLWLAARLITALALLVMTMRAWQPLQDPRTRYWLLAGSLAIALTVNWMGLAYPQAWPRTFIAGQGLTAFKVGAEYLIIAILLFPAVIFYRRARQPQSYDAVSLFAASVITILSELSFTLYSDVSDIFNLLGHLYKIVAYIFIYRAVFMGSVHEPFQRLGSELTENKRIATELKTASNYNRSLIEASVDPLVTISAEGKVTDVNKATEKITGCTRSELIGTDFSDYFTEPEKAREGYQKVFLQGSITDYPLALRHRDGHATDVLYNASVYRNESGEVLGVFAAARDITVYKHFELMRTQLAAIVEYSNDAIIGKTIDGIIISWNRGAERIYGYAANEIIGKHVGLLAPVSLHAETNELIEKVRKGEIVVNHETERIRKDGTLIQVALSLSPIMDAAGNVSGISTIARDITERKKAEFVLRQSEESLKEAQRIAHLGSWYLDIATNQVVWSEELYKMYGFDPAFPPPPYTESMKLFTPESWERLSAAIANAIATGSPYELELEMAPKDGENRWMLARGELVRDERGTPVRVRGVAMDITERNRAELKLRESEQAFRMLAENSPDVIVRYDREGRRIYVNPEFERVNHLTAKEVYGKKPLELSTELKPKADEFTKQLMAAMESGISTKVDLSWVNKDGKQVCWFVRVVPEFDASGNVVSALTIWSDITERVQAEAAFRESEQRLRTLVQTIPDLIWLKDMQGQYLSCNPAFERFFGKNEADIVGKTDYDFVDRELADFFRAQDQEAIAADKPSINNEWITFASDGHRALVQTTKIPMRTTDGKLIGVLGVARDITELKQAEDEIRALNRNLEQRVAERTAQLEALNNELEAFSYSVSHDLRTPLRAIDGFSHILLDDYADKLDDEGKRLLKVVRDNTNRMGQLIDDILKFSRAGRVEISFSEIDMERLAREVLDELQPVITGTKPQVDIMHIPSAKGDRAMMHQVFVNLLSNAIKFSRNRESVRIEVGASLDKGETIYYVKDNGVGFDMQYVGKLFGVFQRLHSMEEFEGTGIGLAIVKRIISRHGGRVWAEGKLNEGATVYFALPTMEATHG